jgi:NADH dehydrogenase [ubiquinone] 1 alpha subcomplex assembly factor 1
LDHGDCEILYKFNNKETIDKWLTSTDSGYALGQSKAKFNLTQHNTALFSGNLTTKINNPENSKSQYSGYVNVHSLKQYGPFMIKKSIVLNEWTHFLFKVKGDGRSYNIILNTPGFYTATNNDFYQYPLFTRGGPYWQFAKIPFSKFVSATNGRFTDKQHRFLSNSVTNIGITLMDQTNGPFSLEIDYIGLVKDKNGYEEFSYEMYKAPKYVANV